MKYKKTIAAVGAVATIGTAAVIEKQSTSFKTYIHGSPRVAHDIYYGLKVDGAIKYGLYCTNPTELLDANKGDVVITMRADSADSCRYISPDLPTIAIAGWDNESRFVGDEWIDNALTISNGSSYGKSINYYIDESSLSAAMPAMANIVTTVNQARVTAELPILGTSGIRLVLDKSSDKAHEISGRYYGQRIDIYRAIELATAPTSTPINAAGFLPAVLFILGG